jgi:2,3-bisphosphoglycerate-dependent phosphoglycerate mutase
LRHGQTAWNAEHRIQGHTDIPLDTTGHWQATQLARALADEPLAAIYSSDLLRAWATAQPLAAATGAPLVSDRRLRERGFGAFEGHTYADIDKLWPPRQRAGVAARAAPGPKAASRWKPSTPAA